MENKITRGPKEVAQISKDITGFLQNWYEYHKDGAVFNSPNGLKDALKNSQEAYYYTHELHKEISILKNLIKRRIKKYDCSTVRPTLMWERLQLWASGQTGRVDTVEFIHTLIQDIRNKLRNLNPDDVRGAEFAKILADVEYLNKYFVKHKAGLKDG